MNPELKIWQQLADAMARFTQTARHLPREGKHRQGHRGRSNYRQQLRGRRKRERQARKLARRIDAGRKHRR